jgi:hypothetical protein
MNNELHRLRATAERLRSDPEAARKLFVQANIYTEEGNLSEAFGGAMNKERVVDQTNCSNTNNITLPAERSNKWQLKLFGKGSDFIYIPPLSHEPTWFVRVMCRYLLDCHWVRIDKSVK